MQLRVFIRWQKDPEYSLRPFPAYTEVHTSEPHSLVHDILTSFIVLHYTITSTYSEPPMKICPTFVHLLLNPLCTCLCVSASECMHLLVCVS